jgi:prophage DNA circulation protein
MSFATSTIEASVGVTAAAFADALKMAAADATSVFRVVYGIDDGNDYGRYFFGQDALVTYTDAATSIASLIAQGVMQQEAAAAAATDLVEAGFTAIAGFGAACDTAAEALRLACANPADAVRLLAALAGFAMGRRLANPPTDAIGQQIYVLAARAVLRLRVAATQSLVRATADYQPTSQQDAQAVRDGVCFLIDALALKCADIFDDATSTRLDSARVAVFEDLTARGAALSQVVSVALQANLPAPVVAYRLYGDATRAGDLVARNEPPHPGFMPIQIEGLAR